MTTSHHIGTEARRESAVLELAIAILAVVVLAVLWLAFFTIVPLEFSPPRIR